MVSSTTFSASIISREFLFGLNLIRQFDLLRCSRVHRLQRLRYQARTCVTQRKKRCQGAYSVRESVKWRSVMRYVAIVIKVPKQIIIQMSEFKNFHEKVRITPASKLRGDFQLPGDKSISHRSAMFAAIGEGISKLSNYSSARDCQSTLDCLEA